MGKVDKMKMLFFFHENPFSSRAGNVTRCRKNLEIFHQLGYEIDLYGSYDVYDGIGDSFEINSNLISNHYLIKRRPKKDKLSGEYWRYKILKSVQKKENNIFLTDYFLDQFNKITQNKKYDVIFINYEMWTGLVNFKQFENSLKVVDTHDWMTLNEFYKNKQLKIGKRFEEELKNLDKFDRIITISSDEYFVFKNFLGNKVFNIPPSFKENFVTDVSYKKYDLLFVGSDNAFNILSIKWFLKNVLPLLPKEIKICILGRVCKHIDEYENIDKKAFVEDISEIYNQSKIAICPMLQGTGIKIKVIEALSYGLPIVGTEKAVDGFNSKKNNGCLICDSPNGFKENIMNLLQDEHLYNDYRLSASNYFRENFSEEQAIKNWRKVLKPEKDSL